MPSFGKALAAALLLALVAPGLHAQSSQPETLFKQALAREATLRAELQKMAPPSAVEGRAEAPAAALRQRVRTLVGSYEDMARLFPESGYSDNSLWQAARLSADAYWQFGDGVDRANALRLFDGLTARFPTSSLVKQVPAQMQRLSAATAKQPVASEPPKPAAAINASSTLTAIRREVLPEALRITLELEREVVYHQERIEGPPRVFIDLPNTRAADPLKDALVVFPDDVVKQVRVGRQLNARTRVVLDLAQGAARYSVYTLYSPYRIVIDFERTQDTKDLSKDASAPGASWTPAPAPVAPIAPTSEARVAPTNEAGVAPTPPSSNTNGGFSLSRQLGLGVARVVIDPGHGGRDPGAKARGLTEADLVLDVALRLEKLLLKQKGVEVVLTRRTNSYVPLEERTAIANRAGADLFLSIHANSSAVETARGVETYFLNFAPNPEAEAIAARENAGAARTMRHLPDIVRAIALNNKIDESRDFATMVQSTLYERLRKVNRQARNLGVKQAPFMVLIDATMPSILAEISFITNTDEAKLLKTEKYRQQIADALLAGVMRYQQSLKKVPAIAAR